MVDIPIFILKDLKPHRLAGWLRRPGKITPRLSEEEKIVDTMEKCRRLLDEIEGIPPQPVQPRNTSHLRLASVDGKIIHPDFQ